MNIRGIALAVIAFFGLASLADAEIVVLINGNRMDVQSYEIQTSVVVVTTWDGKVQSFPISWVDVEATKNVSHQYDPTQGVPRERLQRARMLLERFGVHTGVASLFDEVEHELRSLRGGITQPTYDVVLGSFRNAYDGQHVFDVVVGDFARVADDALLDRWSRWMSRPESQHLLTMGNDGESGEDYDIEKSRYIAEIYSNPDMTYRQELVGRLDNAVRASETSLEIATALAESLQDTRRLVLTSPPPQESVDEIRERLWPDVRKATLDTLLFTYRAATNEELNAYIAFWESEDGRRIAELTLDALASGAQYGAEMAVHGVAEGTGGTLQD